MLTGAIFDVDGVLLASPHEHAWREALDGITEPSRLTTEIYQTHVAGKPRLTGAQAALEALGVPGAERLVQDYAERKQRRLEELIKQGAFSAFSDALRFVDTILALKWKMAVGHVALGLEREDPVQALGPSFTVSTSALAVGLALHGALPLTATTECSARGRRGGFASLRRRRAILDWLPSDNHPHAMPSMVVVHEHRVVAAKLDHASQLPALLISATDRLRGLLVHHEHCRTLPRRLMMALHRVVSSRPPPTSAWPLRPRWASAC
jgi:hypothetical protein